MNDFIAERDRAVLESNGLASFDALWALRLEAVDEPNTERGGWSSVYRLELGDTAYDPLMAQRVPKARAILAELGIFPLPGGVK